MTHGFLPSGALAAVGLLAAGCTGEEGGEPTEVEPPPALRAPPGTEDAAEQARAIAAPPRAAAHA